MARPSASIILESTPNATSGKSDQVIESNGVWAVYYKNKPINLKTISIRAFIAPRYKPTSFANKGHAINLAKKLNKQFNTTDFTVVILSHAETIYSE